MKSLFANCPEGATYDELRRQFRWQVPRRFNMGVACSDQQASNSRALIDVKPDGRREQYTFAQLSELSNRLANALRAIGINAGDRLAIVLPQRVETALAYLAAFKLGAIVVPLSILFGPDALRYRLGDSGAAFVITDNQHVELLASLARDLGHLRLIVTDGARAPQIDFWGVIEKAAPRFRSVATTPDTAALLIYTSGTTGEPKGALHGHRVLLGHMPGFDLSHDFFPHANDLFWTPADWAWIGGLLDALLPTLLHGRPIVAAQRKKFDPEWAVRLAADLRIRNVFFPPTVLKLMRQADVDVTGVQLRSLMCGGEPLGEEILQWARERLGITINEIYGQTECNYVVGNCAACWPVRPGSMGRPYPGHDVAVIDEGGNAMAAGAVGQIAIRVPDPVAFLGYWQRPDATKAKFISNGNWLTTGDMATRDDDGYLWFHARNDDVITSAGYRIGPVEIETCLLHHPAVAMAAVIGVPDPIRGQAVKAFIQLAAGYRASTSLEREIQRIVRERLAAYLYPREIEFVTELPLTVTGKIRRVALREMESARIGTSS